MSDSHAAYQSRDGAVVKDITDHAVGFALVETTLGSTGDDSTSILTTMLEEGKTLCDFCSDIDSRIVQKKTEDATHYVDGKPRVRAEKGGSH